MRFLDWLFNRKSKEQMILYMLAVHGEMFGLDMVYGSKGLLNHGSIYHILADMEERGLVTRTVQVSRRHLFRITAAGKESL